MTDEEEMYVELHPHVKKQNTVIHKNPYIWERKTLKKNIGYNSPLLKNFAFLL